MRTPASSNSAVVSDSRTSHPLTSSPRARKTRARADTPAPPTPMRWTFIYAPAHAEQPALAERRRAGQRKTRLWPWPAACLASAHRASPQATPHSSRRPRCLPRRRRRPLPRVLLLVAASEGSGDEHHRQAHSADLGDRAHPAPADDEVGLAHQRRHVVGEHEPAVSRSSVAGDAIGSLHAGDVRHLFKTLDELVERTPHRLIDVARTLAAARDEQAARRHLRSARPKAVA